MKWWAGCFLFLLFCACSGKDNLPAGVLGKDKMEMVMWDMIQADQYYREYLLSDSLKKDVKKARYDLYEKVFAMHKVTRPTFDKSFEYYSTHPQLMREIFDSLSIKGNRKLQDFYKPAITPVDTSVQRKLKPRIDSIKPK